MQKFATKRAQGRVRDLRNRRTDDDEQNCGLEEIYF